METFGEIMSAIYNQEWAYITCCTLGIVVGGGYLVTGIWVIGVTITQ